MNNEFSEQYAISNFKDMYEPRHMFQVISRSIKHWQVP